MKRNQYKPKLIASLAAGKVLDCGYVWNPNPYLKNAIGIDVEQSKRPSNYSKTVTADLNERFPFENKTFDTVIAGDIIEHLYNPFGFLGECKRILNPKGKLIISTPNKLIYQLHDDSPFHLNAWNYSQFRRLLSHYFDIERCYGSTFNFFGIKINFSSMPFLSHIVIYECRQKK